MVSNSPPRLAESKSLGPQVSQSESVSSIRLPRRSDFLPNYPRVMETPETETIWQTKGHVVSRLGGTELLLGWTRRVKGPYGHDFK